MIKMELLFQYIFMTSSAILYYLCFFLPDLNFMAKVDVARYPKLQLPGIKVVKRNVAGKYNPKTVSVSIYMPPSLLNCYFYCYFLDHLYSPHNPFPTKDNPPFARY